MEIVGKGLERSTSEGIKIKWGNPLCVVTASSIVDDTLDRGALVKRVYLSSDQRLIADQSIPKA